MTGKGRWAERDRATVPTGGIAAQRGIRSCACRIRSISIRTLLHFVEMVGDDPGQHSGQRLKGHIPFFRRVQPPQTGWISLDDLKSSIRQSRRQGRQDRVDVQFVDMVFLNRFLRHAACLPDAFSQE